MKKRSSGIVICQTVVQVHVGHWMGALDGVGEASGCLHACRDLYVLMAIQYTHNQALEADEGR